MKTSVLVSTYNGETYIGEQLKSLLGQSVKADEVLIRDDCSTDSTCELIRSFIQENGLDNWSLTINKANVGFRKNFRFLAEEAKGDVIFFCDQDDVWGQYKIETCIAFLEDCPEIDLICTDYVSSQNKSDIGRLRNSGKSDSRVLERVRPHLGKPYIWLGCAMAVRSSFINDVMPYWLDDWAHDECMWCMSQVAGSCAILHENHLWHREHGGNATGKRVHDKKKRVALLSEKSNGYAEVVRFCQDKGIIGEGPTIFEGMMHCEQMRVSFLQDPSVGKALSLLRFLRLYPEPKSYLADMAVGFGVHSI